MLAISTASPVELGYVLWAVPTGSLLSKPLQQIAAIRYAFQVLPSGSSCGAWLRYTIAEPWTRLWPSTQCGHGVGFAPILVGISPQPLQWGHFFRLAPFIPLAGTLSDGFGPALGGDQLCPWAPLWSLRIFCSSATWRTHFSRMLFVVIQRLLESFWAGSLPSRIMRLTVTGCSRR